ncbi:MAG: TIGR01906 family membrane protein [Coriobacteriia bacterium]|nr:TIGR01906 family membrane protein [Coriobacteriia bacterium]
MRAITALVAGLMLALMVIGLALIPMLHPTFTKVLAQRYSETSQAGLTQAQMLHNAELVREFVADGDINVLPATVGSRPGFDEAAVSHLRDVRRVLSGARTFTGIIAALVVIWLGVETSRKRFHTIAWALMAAAGFCLLFVVLGALAGTMNFDALFTWFHGLFFAAGTWEFPYDSLLIQLFPEGFWIAAGVTWATIVAIVGVLLGVAGLMIRNAELRASSTKVNG